MKLKYHSASILLSKEINCVFSGQINQIDENK